MKVPPCLKPYLQCTNSWDRNNNLFTCMKQVRQLNPYSSFDDLHQTSLLLNKHLQSPLSNRECRTIAVSVLKHQYKSSCFPFRKYCDKSCNCNNKPYNTTKRGLWKHLDKKNRVKIVLKEGVTAYPWDIEDVGKLTSEQAERVMELREFKRVNPMIDKVLGLRDVEIGDEALESWNKHRGVI